MLKKLVQTAVLQYLYTKKLLYGLPLLTQTWFTSF